MSLLDGWIYCPRCAGQLTRHGDRVECAECGFVLYGHSAVTASALPEDDQGRLLLARRGVEPDRGLWDCLGGFVHEGEHPLDGVRREVHEETGVDFARGDVLGTWTGSYDGRATLNLFWRGRLSTGEPRPSDDVAELRWFAREALPADDELAFAPLIPDVLRAWREEGA